MKEITLTKGKVALVDDADYDYLMQWKWNAYKAPKKEVWYALRKNSNRKTVSMHRLLLQTAKGKITDHKNGNGLDNQRHNLRSCDCVQSCQNRGLRADNTSGLKGISWREAVQKWTAQLTVNKDKIHLGYYQKKMDAAVAYDEAAQIYFGEFARLNFSYDPACYI